MVCREDSGAYSEAITWELPDAAQCRDRWHIRYNTVEAVHKEVSAHPACWAHPGPPIREGKRATSNHERWHQVHNLLDKGVGLLECVRRLNLALDTVKRYARVRNPSGSAPRSTALRWSTPYRHHLRERRAEAAQALQLLEEVKTLGYTGSQDPLYRTSPKPASNPTTPNSPRDKRPDCW